jgi:bifunctional non-homologous end joining protein LigD
VVAERRDSLYEPGERSGAWRKLKLELSQEFVVGGLPAGIQLGGRAAPGVYEGRKLRFAGKVKPDSSRTRGASCSGSCSLSAPRPARSPTCRLEAGPLGRRRDRGGDARDAVGEAEVVVQVRFVEWTGEGRLRHAAFVGSRSDIEPSEVRRE